MDYLDSSGLKNQKRKNKMSKKIKELLNEKYILERKLRNKKLDFWMGLIIMILFFWTGIGLILGAIIFFFGVINKGTIEKRLIFVNHEIRKKER